MADDARARFRATLDSMLYFDAGDAPSPAPRALSDASGSAPPPARPGDRGDFLRRLATFRPSSWFAKPAAVSAVACSRRGWCVAEPDVLRCECCGAKIALKISPGASREATTALASKFASKLDDAHLAECGWRGAECPASVARFPCASDDRLRKDFAARKEAARSALEALPAKPLVDPAGLFRASEAFFLEKEKGGAGRGAISPGARSAETNAAETRERVAGRIAETRRRIHRTLLPEHERDQRQRHLRSSTPCAAAALALCGWTADATLEKGVVFRCDGCGARAATWNFAAEASKPSSSRPGNDPARLSGAKRARASGAALMGALGGAFDARTASKVHVDVAISRRHATLKRANARAHRVSRA